MASGTNTTGDTAASRFQYPAQPRPKAAPKSKGKAAPPARAKVKGGKARRPSR